METRALPHPGPSSGGVFSDFFRFPAAFPPLSSRLVKTLVLNTVIACRMSEFADVGDSCRAHNQGLIQKRRVQQSDQVLSAADKISPAKENHPGLRGAGGGVSHPCLAHPPPAVRERAGFQSVNTAHWATSNPWQFGD